MPNFLLKIRHFFLYINSFILLTNSNTCFFSVVNDVTNLITDSISPFIQYSYAKSLYNSSKILFGKITNT